MTPELDIILGLLKRNLELASVPDNIPPSPNDKIIGLGWEEGYEAGLRQAASEIGRLRDRLNG